MKPPRAEAESQGSATDSQGAAKSATRNERSQFVLKLLVDYYDRGLFVHEPPHERPSVTILKFLRKLPAAQLPRPIEEIEKLLDDLHIDHAVVQMYQHLVETSGTFDADLNRVPTEVLGRPKLVDAVLQSSPENFGPSNTQVEGMDQFQPRALAKTQFGEDFRRRKAANTKVLASDKRAHPSGSGWFRKVRSSVDQLHPVTGVIRWGQIDGLSKRIASELVLGTYDPDYVNELEEKMRKANAHVVFHLAKPMLIAILSGEIEGDATAKVDKLISAYKMTAPPTVAARLPNDSDVANSDENKKPDPFVLSLATRAEVAPTGSLLRLVANDTSIEDRSERVEQAVHWLFAIRATLAAHTIYTLALLAKHPQIRSAVCAELTGIGSVATLHETLASAADAERLRLLENTILEAGRLFPAVPIMLRKVEQRPDKSPLPTRVKEETQVLIHHAANNRSKQFVGKSPNRFDPNRWNERHCSNLPMIQDQEFAATLFGNGGKTCPGRNIGLLLIKAVVGQILLEYDIKSVTNRIPGEPLLDPMKIPMSYDQFGITLAVDHRSGRI